MAAGVVLDTSFLITLADPQRPHHEAARQYWRYFSEKAMPIYLPTIVVSEFYVKQEIPPEILRSCVLLPFNWDDALQAAAALDFSKAARGKDERVALKDDVKIIAQALVKDAAWIITDDTRTLHKFASQLKKAGNAKFRPIKLDDGFDPSLLDADGQQQLPFATDEGEGLPQE